MTWWQIVMLAIALSITNVMAYIIGWKKGYEKCEKNNQAFLEAVQAAYGDAITEVVDKTVKAINNIPKLLESAKIRIYKEKLE